MAVHQRINGNYRTAHLYMPHNSSGHLDMTLSRGTTVNFHMPKGAELAMLFDNGKRVRINERNK